MRKALAWLIVGFVLGAIVAVGIGPLVFRHGAAQPALAASAPSGTLTLQYEVEPEGWFSGAAFYGFVYRVRNPQTGESWRVLYGVDRAYGNTFSVVLERSLVTR